MRLGVSTPLGTWDLGYLPPPGPTPSGGHQNTYGWQAGGTHPTGMLSCLMIFFFATGVLPGYQLHLLCSRLCIHGHMGLQQ